LLKKNKEMKMEWHIRCDKKDIARYIFCPGDYARAKRIADHFENPRLVSDSRGYMVYSGNYQGIFMTACGTGMGGPTVAIALEELAHMGADTFIRVGSCGVFQDGQKPGDVIISSGTVRGGGTGNGYLPLMFPAVPTFKVLQQLVTSAAELKLPVTVGVGVAHDLFYSPHSDNERSDLYKKAGLVSIEMESDTLFLAGMYRGWRTGAIFTSDGTPNKIKPESGEEDFRKGELNSIKIALHAMRKIAETD
jgi:uridine phosphorylase